MTQPAEAAFHAAFPELPPETIPAAYERFRDYVRLAAEIATTNVPVLPGRVLTEPTESVSVSAGKVDPGTFTNTG